MGTAEKIENQKIPWKDLTFYEAWTLIEAGKKVWRGSPRSRYVWRGPITSYRSNNVSKYKVDGVFWERASMYNNGIPADDYVGLRL